MHTQTESTEVQRGRSTTSSGVIAGLSLYLLTISGEVVLGAGVRWLLVYLGAAITGTILPLAGAGAEGLAWVAALAPLVWSLVGLALPGRGRVWGRHLGTRRPTSEEATALEDALALLRSVDPGLAGATRYLVLDDPLPGAAVRGRTLTISRGLLDQSESLPAVLAHELGHVGIDGRLTEALERLALWGDPLATDQPETWRGGEVHHDERGGLLWGLLRWTLRLAGGGLVRQLLSPLWAAHWRAREYAADAYAASLGQAEDLASYLADQEQPFDAPQPGLFFNSAEHPPVALRIERLLGSFGREGSK